MNLFTILQKFLKEVERYNYIKLSRLHTSSFTHLSSQILIQLGSFFQSLLCNISPKTFWNFLPKTLWPLFPSLFSLRITLSGLNHFSLSAFSSSFYTHYPAQHSKSLGIFSWFDLVCPYQLCMFLLNLEALDQTQCPSVTTFWLARFG